MKARFVAAPRSLAPRRARHAFVHVACTLDTALSTPVICARIRYDIAPVVMQIGRNPAAVQERELN